MNGILLIDFAGTLIRNEMIQQANTLRANILQKAAPTTQEHAQEQTLYANNREALKQLTGLSNEEHIRYTTNEYQQLIINGEDVHNQIATTLFQLGMYIVANENKQDIYVSGMIGTLEELKKRGHILAISSGVRTDIISGVLAITGQTELFSHILGQPPRLGISNETHLRELQSKGKILYAIGDKYSDLEPAKKYGVETVYVTWGTPTGEEETIANHTVQQPEELLDILREQ